MFVRSLNMGFNFLQISTFCLYWHFAQCSFFRNCVSTLFHWHDSQFNFIYLKLRGLRNETYFEKNFSRKLITYTLLSIQNLGQSYTPVNGWRDMLQPDCSSDPSDPPLPPVWDWDLQYSKDRRDGFTQPVPQTPPLQPLLNGNLNTNPDTNPDALRVSGPSLGQPRCTTPSSGHVENFRTQKGSPVLVSLTKVKVTFQWVQCYLYL